MPAFHYYSFSLASRGGMDLVEFLGFVFLISGLMLLAGKVVQNSIAFLVLQSLSLSAIAFYLGFAGGLDWHMLVAGLLTLAIKVIALPLVLYKIVDRVKAARELPLSVGLVTSVLVGVLIIGLTYAYIVPVLLQDVKEGGSLLPVAMSVILLGCFYMISRCSVISQIIGIIVIENGLYLSALAITGGMPLMIELGIFFDVLVGALVMGVITYKINDNFDTLDTQELTKLKG